MLLMDNLWFDSNASESALYNKSPFMWWVFLFKDW